MALVSLSSQCSQEVIHRCNLNGLTGLSSWIDANGNSNSYWHGDHELGCQCALSATCKTFDRPTICNCDARGFNATDEGILSSENLPVYEVRLGGSYTPYSSIKFNVGPLVCTGKNGFYPSEQTKEGSNELSEQINYHPRTRITATRAISGTVPPTSNAVFVLNGGLKPMVITFDGVLNEDVDLKYGSGVQRHYLNGCAVTMKNQFWYLGGYYKRQVLMILGCQVVRLPDLPFDFQYGSCNTFKPSEEKTLMCFGVNRGHKECYIFDGADFTATGSSKCDHQYAGLANYKGSALTTGSYNAECSNRTEVYNFDTDQWTDAPDFPFESSIYAYAVASTRHAAFIIGGRNKQYSSPEYYRNVIAKFQDDQWTRYGSLKKARHSHGAIVFGDQTMIIGGYSGGQTCAPTEVWNFYNGRSNIILPSFGNSDTFGLGLYLVNSDFCKKKEN